MNSNLTNVSLTDTLPANVVIASPANAGTTCANGSVVTTANSVSLSGATVPKQVNTTPGSCTFSVNVKSSTAGSYNNVIPANSLQSAQGVSNANAASNLLNVQSISVSKIFSPTDFQVGSTSTLRITLQNPSGLAYTGAAITDTLPSGLFVAAIPNASTTCVNGHVSTGGSSVTLTGGTIPPASVVPSTPGFCYVYVDVTSSTAATYTNRIPAGALTTDQLASNNLPTSANVNVYGLGLGVSATKSFSPSTIVIGGISTLRIYVNAPADAALSGVAVTDALPAGVQVAAIPNKSTPGCGSAIFAPAPGDTYLFMSGGSIAKGGTCSIPVTAMGRPIGSRYSPRS